MLKPGLTLYFVRHGETDWNKERRLQGQSDIPLNDTGRGQAARNGRALKDRLGDVSGFDFVASPLSRTTETMEILRETAGLPRQGSRFDANLREIHFGHWEARTWQEVPIWDPEQFQARERDVYNWRPRGGESYADVEVRIRDWLGSVERDTIVVSHGGVSRVLRGIVLGLSQPATMELGVPQDQVLILKDATAIWF